MTIRALIVDDERWARRRIASLLRAEKDFEVVGECADGESAANAILSAAPDVVFLDVQMPGMNGFEVLEAIEPDRWPLVVFVTAYDQYAVHAFDCHALDYLLKPFDEERFQAAIQRVRRDLEKHPDERQTLNRLLKSVGADQRHLRRLSVKGSGRVFFVKIEDVDWMEGTGNYVTLHVGSETHLIRETMNNLEARLDPDQFRRIHRSTIVNLDRVKELRPWFRGEQALVLKDGTQLTVGRVFRSRLRHLLENTLAP